MLKSVFFLVAVMLLFASSSFAQKSTEMYIPIGESPGLSGKYTSIGTVDVVDARDGTLTCTDASGTITIDVDKHTKIWLDRSKLKLPNIQGSLSDCHKGMIVEVKYRNNDRKPGAVADWIKVQTTEASEE